MKIFIQSLILLSTSILYAQNSTKLVIKDTRSINELPKAKSLGVEADFKFRTTIGVPGSGIYSTNITISPWLSQDNSGGENHQLNFNQGGIFYRKALPLAAEWGAWQQLILANNNGNVGIGTPNPKHKLDVNGTIHSKEVKVDMDGWADYVFKKDYALPTLQEVEQHIQEKGHLPNIPSEKEVIENGLSVGENQKLLLQKIEELTLYIIEQNKSISEQQKQINSLNQKIEKISNEK